MRSARTLTLHPSKCSAILIVPVTTVSHIKTLQLPASPARDPLVDFCNATATKANSLRLGAGFWGAEVQGTQ